MSEKILTRNEAAIAFAEGKAVEFIPLFSKQWEKVDRFELFDQHESLAFRLKPEPRKVPLGPEDIDLHRDLFRSKQGTSDTGVALSKNQDSVFLAHYGQVSFAGLYGRFQISRDGGKTWHACEKEAEA